MDDTEHNLVGGNISDSVVRIGATVRKSVTPATPSIELLLIHLHSVGFDGAPQSLGRDHEGRHVLEYIPGAPCSMASRMTLSELERVGGLIRKMHEALAGFEPSPPATWNILMPCDGYELICHNDLAPWNLIRNGDRWAFIDWDGAAPGTRLWDLSYAALTFAPIEPQGDLEEAGIRVRAILDGYMLNRAYRRELLQNSVRRARAMYDLIAAGHRSGRQPWARLYAEGHAEYWGPVADYIQLHLADLAGLAS